MSRAQQNKRKQGYGGFPIAPVDPPRITLRPIQSTRATDEVPPAQPYAPIQRNVQQVDPVAAQALQENMDNAQNPQRKYVGNTGKKNSYIDTYTNKTAGVETQITNTPNHRRGRAHDIGFRDVQGQGYEQRPNKGTPYDRKLRSEVVKDQISRGLEAQGGLNSGDRVTANPTSKGRARLYRQIGGKAFEATPDRVGDLTIDSRVTRDGGIITKSGKKVPMPNIKGLRSGLSQMAVRRMMAAVGGPPTQALMTVDSMLKQTTGKGLFEHHQEQMLKSVGAYSDAGVNLPSWGYSAPF